MPHQHPQVRRALQLRHHDEIGLAQCQRLGTGQAGDGGPGGQGDGQHRMVEPRAHGRHEGQRQDQAGERQHHIGQAHQHGVDPAAEVARHHAHRQAQRAHHHGDQHHDEQRDAGAVQQAAEHVAAELVGAEPVAGAGRQQGPGQVLPQRVGRRQPRRQCGQQHQQADDHHAHGGEPVAQQPAHQGQRRLGPGGAVAIVGGDGQAHVAALGSKTRYSASASRFSETNSTPMTSTDPITAFMSPSSRLLVR